MRCDRKYVVPRGEKESRRDSCDRLLTLQVVGPSRRQHMLPMTDASLVSQLRATELPRPYSRDLERYVRLEYGGDGAAVRAAVAQAARRRSLAVGIRRAFRNALAGFSAALGSATASGGA